MATQKPATAAAKLPPATPVSPAPGSSPTVADQPVDDSKELRLRGYLIEREGSPGEGKSWFQVAPGGGSWTWERDRATVFQRKEDAKPLLLKKKVIDGVTRPAGPAAHEGAEIVKFDAGADDPA